MDSHCALKTTLLLHLETTHIGTKLHNRQRDEDDNKAQAVYSCSQECLACLCGRAQSSHTTPSRVFFIHNMARRSDTLSFNVSDITLQEIVHAKKVSSIPNNTMLPALDATCLIYIYYVCTLQVVSRESDKLHRINKPAQTRNSIDTGYTITHSTIYIGMSRVHKTTTAKFRILPVTLFC